MRFKVEQARQASQAGVACIDHTPNKAKGRRTAVVVE
jgi:hypothetical protein